MSASTVITIDVVNLALAIFNIVVSIKLIALVFLQRRMHRRHMAELQALIATDMERVTREAGGHVERLQRELDGP